MIELLTAIESSGFSAFFKESSIIYILTLALHAIGLAFVVGISITTALRILGVAPALPLPAMVPFFPLMYLGLWITLLSGIVLTIMYPLEYLTEGTIYIKLFFIFVAVAIIKKIHTQLSEDPGQFNTEEKISQFRKHGLAMIISWMIVIFAGRVMAYTWGTMLQTFIAVIITLALMLGFRKLYMSLFGTPRNIL